MQRCRHCGVNSPQTGLARDLLTHAEQAESGKSRRRRSWRDFRQPCRVPSSPRCQVHQHPVTVCQHAAAQHRACSAKPTDANFSPPGVELDAPDTNCGWCLLSRSAPDRLGHGPRRKVGAASFERSQISGGPALHSCDLTIRSPESALLRGSRLFCVTTVSIVCTIKAPVPARAEDGLYRVPLIRTGAPNGRNHARGTSDMRINKQRG